VLRTLWKHRSGQWYSKKTAYRRRGRYCKGRPHGPIAQDPYCPLCGALDGSTHLLLECTHRALKGMHIGRHNKAGRMIQSCLRRHSRAGGTYTVLDVCSQDQLGEQAAAATRIPAWLLPGVDETTRAKLRPDILRVTGLPAHPTEAQIRQARARQSRHRIQIVEVGYAMDTLWRQAYARKEEQHAALTQHLREAGWMVDPPHIVILGACGAVYHSGLQALLALGLGKRQAMDLLTELHHLAVQTAHDITCARRRLESTRQGVG
jgi:hypothetical protein